MVLFHCSQSFVSTTRVYTFSLPSSPHPSLYPLQLELPPPPPPPPSPRKRLCLSTSLALSFSLLATFTTPSFSLQSRVFYRKHIRHNRQTPDAHQDFTKFQFFFLLQISKLFDHQILVDNRFFAPQCQSLQSFDMEFT